MSRPGTPRARGVSRGSGSRRGVAGVLAAGYAAFVGFTVFWPTAHYASGSVGLTTRLLYAAGLPALVTQAMVEFVANIVLFVPLGLLGPVLLGRWGWRFWLVVGLAASSTVELVQLVFLSGRSASGWDVLANTIGAVLGAVLARALFPVRPKRV